MRFATKPFIYIWYLSLSVAHLAPEAGQPVGVLPDRRRRQDHHGRDEVDEALVEDQDVRLTRAQRAGRSDHRDHHQVIDESHAGDRDVDDIGGREDFSGRRRGFLRRVHPPPSVCAAPHHAASLLYGRGFRASHRPVVNNAQYRLT